MNNLNAVDRELAILESIHSRRIRLRQRELARLSGFSLGMTNAVIKRLIAKGWLKISKINNRNIRYVVSARGLQAIARRSYSYFKRTVRNVVVCKEALDELLGRVRSEGYRGVVLIGESDLAFIIEHLCQKRRLEFHRKQPPDMRRLFLLYSERLRSRDLIESPAGASSASLRAVLLECGGR